MTRTLTALKEWALVCARLLDGRQAIMLRKGGIDEKGFWVDADEFLLYPTYFHQMAEKVRQEFAAAGEVAADLLELLEVAGADVGLVVALLEDRLVEGADGGDLIGERERVQGSGLRV